MDSDAATAARDAARVLARNLSDEARGAIYQEHGDLVDKRFTEGLSSREETRLRYLKWQLDRIEDADMGDQLDHLERMVAVHESISLQVTRFAAEAREVSEHWKRRR